MAPNSSIISINGKKYDARTGKLLNAPVPHSAHGKKHASSGAVMDGVIRRPAKSLSKLASTHTHKQGSLEKPKSIQKAKPAKAVHGGASKSRTLFRTGLKNPAPKVVLTASGPSNKHNSQAVVAQAPLTPKIDEARLKRAEGVSKSSFISRFSSPKHTAIDKNADAETAVSGEVIMPGEDGASQPTPTSKTVVKHRKANIDDLVDHALATATAHKQHKTKKRAKMPKLASALAILLVVFLLGGFFAYQYIPNFAMRVASQRSGVDASLPSYQASGFSFGSIDTAPGTVEINYTANADKNRSYSLMQKNSNWDSQSLYSNFVLREDKSPQDFPQNNGRTIYLYGDSNATWVSGGVWYVIDGSSAKLTDDQLVKIASSI